MQNASQKMHFFNSYLLTKKDEGDSQMKRMKRKCRARLDFHFIKTKDQFVCHKLYIKAVEGVGKLYNYLHGLVITTKKCVFADQLIIQKRKLDFSITKPCRYPFEAKDFNQERLLYCT